MPQGWAPVENLAQTNAPAGDLWCLKAKSGLSACFKQGQGAAADRHAKTPHTPPSLKPETKPMEPPPSSFLAWSIAGGSAAPPDPPSSHLPPSSLGCLNDLATVDSDEKNANLTPAARHPTQRPPDHRTCTSCPAGAELSQSRGCGKAGDQPAVLAANSSTPETSQHLAQEWGPQREFGTPLPDCHAGPSCTAQSIEPATGIAQRNPRCRFPGPGPQAGLRTQPTKVHEVSPVPVQGTSLVAICCPSGA